MQRVNEWDVGRAGKPCCLNVMCSERRKWELLWNLWSNVMIFILSLQLKFIKWPDCCLDLFVLSERKSSPLARLKHLRPSHPTPNSLPVLLLSWSFCVTMRACGCHLGLVAGAGEGASGKDRPSEGSCALWRRQVMLIIPLRTVCFGSLLNSVINSKQIPPVSGNISIKYWLWVEKKRRQTYEKRKQKSCGKWHGLENENHKAYFTSFVWCWRAGF